MSTQPRYTQRFKLEAIARVRLAGYPVCKGALSGVANQLGVPPSTLSRWLTESGFGQPGLPASTIKSTISQPSAAPSSTFIPQDVENSTTIADFVTTISAYSLPELIAACFEEMALTSVLFHTLFEAATPQEMASACRLIERSNPEIVAHEAMKTPNPGWRKTSSRRCSSQCSRTPRGRS